MIESNDNSFELYYPMKNSHLSASVENKSITLKWYNIPTERESHNCYNMPIFITENGMGAFNKHEVGDRCDK
ncbi:hypothetical protein [Salipaludibacillus agaradhaerens]|uniref:hypothetical protein n=1 Tax=Salipaludibacillus agaradhaerens TaxID=76935 RepID=UPI000997070D|nr:hypothetical protein [Salipaludibacillus agaradhaerens]